MAIQHSVELKDNILYVKASGRDDDINDVIQYGEALIKAAVEMGATYVLCDETELEYAIGTLDTFQAAEYIAKAAPRVGRIAIVCHPRYAKDGKFWETVAVNRGLLVRMFTDTGEAEGWLKNLGKA